MKEFFTSDIREKTITIISAFLMLLLAFALVFLMAYPTMWIYNTIASFFGIGNIDITGALFINAFMSWVWNDIVKLIKSNK
ncbi:hypothetical protein [Scytonema sp. NUACC26]|uniref:hypothetical protein n=1 Tax=Scytonema sp. NUACC26 TaxID=3140176 RepID=UPI0034DBF572